MPAKAKTKTTPKGKSRKPRSKAKSPLLGKSPFLSRRTTLFVAAFIVIGIAAVLLTYAATATATGAVTGLSGKCLDDYHSQTANGNQVDIWKCNQTVAQKWTVTNPGSITDQGHCLDVKNAGTAPGTAVRLWTCNGTVAQKWQDNANGEIINPHSGLCLTVKGGSTGNGTPVWIIKCSAVAAQLWAVPKPPNPVSTPVPVASATPIAGATPTPAPGGGGTSTSTSSTNCAPAPSATMTNTVSHKCGFPDTTNTGATGTLTKLTASSGPSSSTGHGWSVSGDTINVSAGGLLENVNTGGRVVDVNGAGATINNVDIQTSSAQGVAGVALRGANNAVIEHTTIGGGNTGSGRMFVGVKDYESGSTFSANSVIDANNIFYTSTGIQVDHGMVENNYVHDMGMISGDHINGTTSNAGDDNLNLTLQHNTVFNQYSQTDAISLFEDFGIQQNRVINDNLMAGGGYTVYGGQNSGGPAIKNIRITNNHFSKMYYPEGGYWGYIAAFTTAGTGNVWSGNVWDETGAAVGP